MNVYSKVNPDDTETIAERRNKRIIETEMGDFDNAWEAIRFANTVESVLNEKVKVKFKKYIAGRETGSIAVNHTYSGKTVLRFNCLEVPGNEAANWVAEKAQEVMRIHNEVNRGEIKLLRQQIREKPAPQVINH